MTDDGMGRAVARAVAALTAWEATPDDSQTHFLKGEAGSLIVEEPVEAAVGLLIAASALLEICKDVTKVPASDLLEALGLSIYDEGP